MGSLACGLWVGGSEGGKWWGASGLVDPLVAGLPGAPRSNSCEGGKGESGERE